MSKSKTGRLLDDLIGRVSQVPMVADSTVSMVSFSDITNAKRKLALPAVGVFYLGLTPKEGKGRYVEAVYDIIVFGLDKCGDCSEDSCYGLILEQIRESIWCNPKSPLGRDWDFKLETPHPNEDLYAYVQRWGTDLIIKQ